MPHPDDEPWRGAGFLTALAVTFPLTRRLRSVSHRLEGIEDGVHQLNRAFSPTGVEARLSAIEEQLQTLSGRIDDFAKPQPAAAQASAKKASAPGKRKKAAGG